MLKLALSTLCLALASLHATTALAAEKLAIVPFSGVNVHPSHLQAAQELLRDHLAETRRYEILPVPGEPMATELPMAETIALGASVGADLVAAGHITHLQSISRIRVSLYEVHASTVRYTDTLSASGGPDEMDKILKRLASGAALGQAASQNAEVDTVTQDESEPYLKIAATRTVGLRLGAIAPFNRPAGDFAAAPGLGLFWLYDARSYLAEIFLDLYSGSNSSTHAFDVGLGIYYPFSRRDFTPYAGGTVAYAVQDFGGKGGAGLRLQGAGGLVLGRLSTVQVRGEVGYFLNTFAEKSNDGADATVSHGPQLTFGIGF